MRHCLQICSSNRPAVDQLSANQSTGITDSTIACGSTVPPISAVSQSEAGMTGGTVACVSTIPENMHIIEINFGKCRVFQGG